jgi:SAM-dependent methyltransferase
MDAPWEHPDWYDLHDTAWTAGPEREPEHYRELLLSMPPLGAADHLLDIGAGTGKLACQIARGYPDLGQVTLLEPNEPKLVRAAARVKKELPAAEVRMVLGGVGGGEARIDPPATVAIVGSVLMPVMEYQGGTLRKGLDWLSRSLAEIAGWIAPGGWFYDLETLAIPWARGDLEDPVRRLSLLELMGRIHDAGFVAVECVYRFRDRVVVRARAR